MQWFVKTFEQLSTNELYQIMQLRIDVFVVEQNCAYSDLDGLDQEPQTLHLFAIEGNQLCAYLRILAPDIGFASMPAIGRVITHSSARGTGLGHKLMERALAQLKLNWPDLTCHLSAQSHLQKYYETHGFNVVGEGYLEDGIPHIGMERIISL